MVAGIFENPKRAFFEALFLTVVVFVLGLLLGVSFENSRLDTVNSYYALSEVSTIDSIALGQLSEMSMYNCKDMIFSNIQLADKIYGESLTLQKYEDSGKITDILKIAHKKYDALRTLLWINVINSKEKCKNNVSSVVYLYEYLPENLEEKAREVVWSRILFDLKQKEGDKIILIPISVDSNISSLDSLIRNLNITSYPVVVINEKKVLYNLESVEEIEKYLKQ